MRIALVLVVEEWNVAQWLVAKGTTSEHRVPERKNSRRLSWLRFRNRCWFLAVTCNRPVAFAQACPQELQIVMESGEDVLLFNCAGFPSNIVFEVQRNGTLKTACCQSIHKILPVHHTFTQWTVPGRPSCLRFVPPKIFDGNHLQARHHEVRCDFPAAYPAFSHRVTRVEVEANPLRIQRVDH